MIKFTKPKHMQRVHSKRGAPFVEYCIEGELVKMAQIAQRLDVTLDVARRRMARMRTQDAAITWAALRGD